MKKETRWTSLTVAHSVEVIHRVNHRIITSTESVNSLSENLQILPASHAGFAVLPRLPAVPDIARRHVSQVLRRFLTRPSRCSI